MIIAMATAMSQLLRRAKSETVAISTSAEPRATAYRARVRAAGAAPASSRREKPKLTAALAKVRTASVR